MARSTVRFISETTPRPRMWRVQKGDKLVAHCRRGIDINAALQRRQGAMFAGNNVDFRLIHALAVVIQQRNRLLLGKMSRISWRTIANINPKMLLARAWPLPVTDNRRELKYLRRRRDTDTNDVDTIRAVAPEYGQMRSAVLGS
jgi:hypothetical protein